MKSIFLELPFPPSANQYWRYYQGRVLKSRVAKSYIKAVGLSWLTMKKEGFPKDCRLDMEIQVFPKDRRARDLDNLLKITLDSLEAAKVFENDKQVDRIKIVRREQHPEGKMLVLIKPIEKGK